MRENWYWSSTETLFQIAIIVGTIYDIIIERGIRTFLVARFSEFDEFSSLVLKLRAI